jgi:hypothetical protein
MALSNRQTIAATLRAAPVPRSFQHAPAAGKPIAPDEPHPFTADAGTDLLTSVAHGLVADDPVSLESDGTLPGGLSAGPLYVLASGLTADAFKVSATVGGSATNVTDAGTGVHTWQHYLTADEQAEWDVHKAYLTNGSGPLPLPLGLPRAIAMHNRFAAYHQDPAYLTWWHDDQLSRTAQFDLRRADMFAANDPTVPPSGDPGGVPHDPPVSPITRDPD